ncbi:hypothetical protein [Reyranella sp.]|uniref:hypothetical protein n=1 Tax=Reyranella sp. TaxID=1929291 RepID=UPI00378442B0
MVAIFRFTLPTRKEWSAAEQAEFVRTAAILRGTGLPVICETGVSDEGDPWVIFLREDTGDVIAHIAKIDGQVMAASAATGDVVCGPSFRTVMDKVVRSQPLVLPAASLGDRIHLHPSTVIIAFIATALAWSLEDDARLYDWKVDSDGTVALVSGGRDASGNVLRDSLFSKVEASRLGLDTGNHNLSGSLVVAAALAAVAAVAKSLELLGDETDRVAAVPDTTDRGSMVVQHDANAAPADPQNAVPDIAATRDSSGSDQLDVADLGQDGLLWRGVVDGLASHSIKLLFDVGRVGDLPDLPTLPTEKAALADGLIETVALRTLPPVSEMAAEESPAQVVVAAPKVEAEAPTAPATPITHAVALVAPPQGPTFTFHGSSVTVSSEAWKLLFSPELAPRLTFTDGPDSHQPSSISTASTDLLDDVSQPTTAAQTATTQDSGYKLIDDILTFAADSSHELRASAPAIQSLNGALADMSLFLPTADRILIIDLPDLNAGVFQFVKGLLMMSVEEAEKLMPSLDMHTQAEYTLANGQTLKLMGVVDLNDYHPTTSAHV